jgi:DNA-binding NtrC family response regulator
VKILVVDDEPSIRLSIADLLRDDGYDVTAAEHAPAALALLEDSLFDLVLSDLTMPAMDGLQLLDAIRTRALDCVFVLMTAHGDERTAVRALKLGAWDYLPKPFDNDELRALVRRCHEMLALRVENRRLREELSGRVGDLVGDSAAMRAVARMIRRAAPTDATVLITGESGTGKELAARAIHEESTRRNKPFVAINCSALPGDLVESELFGHVKGAFTSADRDRQGVFEAAHGGTLFLDEIGDLALAAQAKLLRALEERVVTPIGSNDVRSVDVRVVAATNQPLGQMVANAGFREDLLYRLSVISIAMPPLRDRREDILPIATHLVAALAKRHSRKVSQLSPDAQRALQSYDWPGNVRELRNALERAIILAESDTIHASDLPAQLRDTAAPLAPIDAALAGLSFTDARERAQDSFDRAFLTAALQRHDGNISATARTLGMHRQSLQKVLKKLGIDSDG